MKALFGDRKRLGIGERGVDVRQLRYFAHIADVGNMTRAAESLHVAQPALTQQIANLEAELGVRVFDRGRHGVQLTAAGEVLYGYAVSVLKQLEDARAAVRDEAEHPGGRVVIGIPGSTGKLVSVPLLRHLAAYDRILLEIVERPSAELLSLVARGRVDIAIVVDAPVGRGTTITPLVLEDLYVITPRGAGRDRANVGLREVAEHPLILPSAPSTIRQRIDTAFMDARLGYQLAAEVSATDMLVRLVAAGLGWTILPWAAVSDEVSRGLVDALPVRRHRLRRELALCVSDTVPLSRATELARSGVLGVIEALTAGGAWQGVEYIART
jgi:LysR family nitrogen assimilation transcriptional regulator